VILATEGSVPGLEKVTASPAASAGGHGDEGPASLERRLRSWRPFPHEVAAAVYIAAGIFILERLPVTYPREALLLAASFPIAWIAGFTAVLLAGREVARRLRGRSRPVAFATEALILVRAALVLAPVLSVHFLLKSFIWLVNPRTWDAQLWELDRIVHFGLSPTLFLTVAFADGGFLRFLDVVYSGAYFFLIVVSVPVLLVVPQPSRRMAFLAAYTFIWMAGSVLYLALPSWGPVFVVSDLFSGVLRHMPATVSVQEVLFGEISSLVKQPLAPRIVRFGSVAAFPSLHLAVVTVFTVASRWVSGRWFLANLVLVVLMLVGSVVTGYHYLVDSWAGIALGLAACSAGSRLFPSPCAATCGPDSPQRP
jgi:hypothetical protein